ncbi:MAG: Tim44/TimA family putative adaptor protein [Pseudomonadota bacterium]|nr:Tim44/TimA family putative adaptor protein [Pseudomonadota bacterium]
MGETGSLFDIFVLALIAGVLAWRLFSVLGRTTPEDESHTGPVMRRPIDGARGLATVIDARMRGLKPEKPADEVMVALMALGRLDPDFDRNSFLDGAGRAFTMIVHAFAEGDTATLRPLLGDALYGDFADAIRDRPDEARRLPVRIERIEDARITAARLEGRKALLTVTFHSMQCGHDPDEPEKPTSLVDIWTFSHYVGMDDPNWTLTATSVPDNTDT